jgi:hypothetical protein
MCDPRRLTTLWAVARIRLVKTENRSVCAALNCKVCRSAIALYLPVVPCCVNKVSINPIIQSKTRFTSHAQSPLHMTMYIMLDMFINWSISKIDYVSETLSVSVIRYGGGGTGLRPVGRNTWSITGRCPSWFFYSEQTIVTNMSRALTHQCESSYRW